MMPDDASPRRTTFSLGEIAELLGAPVVGDPETRVERLVHPAEAGAAGDLVFLMDQELVRPVAAGPARAAVVAEGLAVPEGRLQAWVPVARPRYALALLLELFAKPVDAARGVHPTAILDASATVGDGAAIGAFAYVGPGAAVGARSVLMAHVTVGAGARIGAECLLHSGARIGERVVLGDRVIVHHNASVGSDGFSFVTPTPASFETARRGGDQVAGRTAGLRRINSIGTVTVGDDVEIGACTAIDRANLGATVIGRGTKIDNQVQIAHNCRIGEDCLVSGQVGISGSCEIGNRVVLAGGCGIADHIRIGDDAVVGAGSGVWKDVAPGEVVVGYPAVPRSQLLERELQPSRLRRLTREVAELRRRLDEIERR